MGWLSDPTFRWTASLVLAGIWVTAAAGKLANREAFRGVLHNYRLLPRSLERPAAATLPLVELGTALALLWPPARPSGALASILLLLLFAAAMGINLRRGRREIDCGCFIGVLRQRIGWWLVIRNLALALLAASLLAPAGGREPVWLDPVTVFAASGALLLTYFAVNRVLELAPPAERRT